jgi:hypothetical protein
MTSLYYNNNRTNVTITIVFNVADDYHYPYITKIVVGGTTLKENKFETQEEALRDFMWLVSSNILKEENV